MRRSHVSQKAAESFDHEQYSKVRKRYMNKSQMRRFIHRLPKYIDCMIIHLKKAPSARIPSSEHDW